MINIYPIVDKEDYLLMGQNDPEGRLFLHFEWKGGKFSPSKYKDTLEDWWSILDAFRHMGITEVFSAIPHEWKKERKWQTMFGLEPFAENGKAVYYRLEV